MSGNRVAGEKETRCLGFLSVKCPVFIGLLRTDYAKLFLYDPLIWDRNFPQEPANAEIAFMTSATMMINSNLIAYLRF